MRRVVLTAVALGLTATLVGCDRFTLDPNAAKPPSFAPRSVPEDAGPTRIPRELRLPGEGLPVRNGGNWATERRGGGWPFEPCHHPSSLQSTPERTDSKAIFRTDIDRVYQLRFLALFPDTATATRLMANVRAKLSECYVGTDNGIWLWDSRDVPSLGDDAFEARGEREYRDSGLGVDRYSAMHVVVQVRNAVLLMSSVSQDDVLSDTSALHAAAGEAVATLRQHGWP